VQAAEIRKEQKEINFLTRIISAPADARASFVARAGAALASAGYTGSHSEQQRLQAEQRSLNAEWKRLDEDRAAREARERQEYAELASVSKRLRDLEERAVEDRKRAPASSRDYREHADMLRTNKQNRLGTEAVSSDERQRGRGARSGQGDGKENRQKLDYRPPPTRPPPGTGGLGPPGVARAGSRTLGVAGNIETIFQRPSSRERAGCRARGGRWKGRACGRGGERTRTLVAATMSGPLLEEDSSSLCARARARASGLGMARGIGRSWTTDPPPTRPPQGTGGLGLPGGRRGKRRRGGRGMCRGTSRT